MEEVRQDLEEGRISGPAAAEHYGVIVTWNEDGEPLLDDAATDARHAELRSQRSEALPLIDRGPGFERMKGNGKPEA